MKEKNIVTMNKKDDAEGMVEIFITLPEQAKQYIMGCVDMAKLLHATETKCEPKGIELSGSQPKHHPATL